MSPSTVRSPDTKARATPSSPGAHRMRRTASIDRTFSVPTPSVGPIALPSQNSKRTGIFVPTRARSNGANASATLTGVAVTVRAAWSPCVDPGIPPSGPGPEPAAGARGSSAIAWSDTWVAMLDLLDRFRPVRVAVILGCPVVFRSFRGRTCVAARAHARSGDWIAIASYLGKGHSFDEAVADFSAAYADQNERDYEALVAAVRSGRITAQTGL